MTKRILALACGLVLIGIMTWGEPYYVAVSVTQTVQSKTLPRYTQVVTIVSESTSANTCYYRLFTDVDTTGNATTASTPIKPGETIKIPRFVPASPTGEHPSGVRDSESFSTAGARASYYKSLSAICDTGGTATWRVYAK